MTQSPLQKNYPEIMNMLQGILKCQPVMSVLHACLFEIAMRRLQPRLHSSNQLLNYYSYKLAAFVLDQFF